MIRVTKGLRILRNVIRIGILLIIRERKRARIRMIVREKGERKKETRTYKKEEKDTDTENSRARREEIGNSRKEFLLLCEKQKQIRIVVMIRATNRMRFLVRLSFPTSPL